MPRIEDTDSEDDELFAAIKQKNEEVLPNEGIADAENTEEDTFDRGTINEGTIKNGTINEGTINKSTINEGTINEGTINKGTISEGIINEGTINEGTINEGTINEGTINEGAINEGTINGGIINGGIIDRVIMERDMINEGTIEDVPIATSDNKECTLNGDTAENSTNGSIDGLADDPDMLSEEEYFSKLNRFGKRGKKRKYVKTGKYSKLNAKKYKSEYAAGDYECADISAPAPIPYQCDQCNMTYMRKSQLDYHIRTKHGPDADAFADFDDEYDMSMRLPKIEDEMKYSDKKTLCM